MRIAVFLFIADVAVFMGVVALRGGAIVFSAAQCLAASGFDPAICASDFSNADRIARASATVFTNTQRCLASNDACVRSSAIQGFASVPAELCIAASEGALARQEPVYRRSNAPRIEGSSG